MLGVLYTIKMSSYYNVTSLQEKAGWLPVFLKMLPSEHAYFKHSMKLSTSDVKL